MHISYSNKCTEHILFIFISFINQNNINLLSYQLLLSIDYHIKKCYIYIFLQTMSNLQFIILYDNNNSIIIFDD